MFGGYSHSPTKKASSRVPSKSQFSPIKASKAPANTSKLAANFNEKVKKGKQPGEARVSMVNFDWTAPVGKEEGKDSTPRVLFPVKRDEGTGLGISLGSNEVAAAEEDEDMDKGTPTLGWSSSPLKGTPSAAGSDSSAATPTSNSVSRVRGRYDLRDLGGVLNGGKETPKKSKKRKREKEQLDS
jgi:hypothetical protein